MKKKKMVFITWVFLKDFVLLLEILGMQKRGKKKSKKLLQKKKCGNCVDPGAFVFQKKKKIMRIFFLLLSLQALSDIKYFTGLCHIIIKYHGTCYEGLISKFFFNVNNKQRPLNKIFYAIHYPYGWLYFKLYKRKNLNKNQKKM